MPKKDIDGDSIISETGNWNVADTYSKAKIATPLMKCDYYEDIAKFGYESIIDEFINNGLPNDFIRYNGLKRLISELIKLCKNASFALRVAKTKEEVAGYEKGLRAIEKKLPVLISSDIDEIDNQHIIELQKDKFERVLNFVLDVKAKINEPLNKNHLIFTDREEFDPSAFKKNMKDRIINQG